MLALMADIGHFWLESFAGFGDRGFETVYDCLVVDGIMELKNMICREKLFIKLV